MAWRLGLSGGTEEAPGTWGSAAEGDAKGRRLTEGSDLEVGDRSHKVTAKARIVARTVRVSIPVLERIKIDSLSDDSRLSSLHRQHGLPHVRTCNAIQNHMHNRNMSTLIICYYNEDLSRLARRNG